MQPLQMEKKKPPTQSQSGVCVTVIVTQTPEHTLGSDKGLATVNDCKRISLVWVKNGAGSPKVIQAHFEFQIFS